MSKGDAFIVGIIVGVVAFAIPVAFLTEPNGVEDRQAHEALCPTILEQSHTAADSLAVFQKHEGCWDYVQRGKP